LHLGVHSKNYETNLILFFCFVINFLLTIHEILNQLCLNLALSEKKNLNFDKQIHTHEIYFI
jgi:hypothetical protein